MKKKHLYTILTLVLMIFIFSQSALPANLSEKESAFIASLLMKILRVDRENLSFIIRKSAHFIEYTFLGCSLILTVRAWLEDPPAGHRQILWSYRKMNIIAWGIGALYAITDELHQSLVSGRSCELRDVMIDSAGVALGIFLCSTVLRMQRKKKQ